jgi:hypothetical protein
MTGSPHNSVEVLGAIIQGFLHACIDLNLDLDLEAVVPIGVIEADHWYPLRLLTDLEQAVTAKYQGADGVLEKIGASMMHAWYHAGPGQEIITRGVEFLFFQSTSQGYRSVVKGPEKLLGSFTLVGFDEHTGTALIRSTTPFNKDMERGIIIGGMSSPRDLRSIKVNNRRDPNVFFVEFR